MISLLYHATNDLSSENPVFCGFLTGTIRRLKYGCICGKMEKNMTNGCFWEDEEYARETFLQKGFSGLFQKTLNKYHCGAGAPHGR